MAGGNLFEGILEFLQSEDADILMLQEVYNGTDSTLPANYRSIQVLNDKFSYPFYDFAPAMLDKVPEGKIESGNAVFSKFPIISSDYTFFDDPYRERNAHDPKEFPTTPRNLQHVVIDIDGKEFNIFNFQGVWDLDGDNFSSRRQHMSEIILQEIKGKPRVILAGDTNAKPTNKAIVALEDQLINVSGHELTTSFNMRRKDNPGYATACVDMIFVTPDLVVVEKRCPDIDISDHLPLIVTLSTL